MSSTQCVHSKRAVLVSFFLLIHAGEARPQQGMKAVAFSSKQHGMGCAAPLHTEVSVQANQITRRDKPCWIKAKLH